jgi:3',5'-cyclic AMP phosphodiesterase CpdA
MLFAQISDLHVSSGHFREDWFESMLRILERSGPDLVIVTGDLTMEGHSSEFDLLATSMDRIRFERLVVPGNHDSMNQGFSLFEELFGTRNPYFENEEIAVQGLDSSKPDINDGEIGRHNYPLIRELGDRNKLRIVALHHHSIPIPGTGREVNVLSDAGDFIKTCLDSGVHLVLSGHRHVPWTWCLDGVYFITAGTACTNRLKGRSHPSINLFEVEGRHLRMETVQVDDGRSEVVIDAALHL